MSVPIWRDPAVLSGEYVIPEVPSAPPVNVLPTERLQEIVEQHNRMAEALIEIATAHLFFDGCDQCGRAFVEVCCDWCPGLLARRALGVA